MAKVLEELSIDPDTPVEELSDEQFREIVEKATQAGAQA